MKHQIKTNRIVESGGHFSQAITVEASGRLVFISGMTARKPDGTIAGIGDIEEQTRQVCENIRAAVEAAGGTLDDVCRQFWKVIPPASTLIEVSKLASPQFLVEISAIALIPNGPNEP